MDRGSNLRNKAVYRPRYGGRGRSRALWLVLATALVTGVWAALQQRHGPALVGVAAVTAAVIPLVVTELRERRAQDDERLQLLKSSLRVLRPSGELVTVEEAQLDDLDISESRRVGQLDRVPYLPRTQDARIDDALKRSRFVLVVGESKAGKSRSAYEAMRRTFPKWALIVPSSRSSLQTLLSQGFLFRDAVLWLDDLEDYLGTEGLNVNILRTLMKDERHSVTVLATIRASARDRLSPKQDITQPEWKVLQRATEVRLARRCDPAERARAAKLFSDPTLLSALERYGLAEYLVAGPELVKRFEDGLAVNPVGHAIVRAAADWHRTGMQNAIPQHTLQELYPYYIEDRSAEYLQAALFQAGLRWAQERIYAASRLLDGDQDGYAVFDYVLEYLQEKRQDPIPGATWETALAVAVDPDEAATVAAAAYYQNRLEVAERAQRRAVASGESGALHNLGAILIKLDRREEAEAWLRRAAEAGNRGSAYSLASLLSERHEAGEQEYWLQRAAEAGHRDAAGMLGHLLNELGRAEEAEQWFRRAAEAGDNGAAHGLAFLLRNKLGRAPEAEKWYRQAAEAGDLAAAHNLASLLGEFGRTNEAEAWWQEAAEAGNRGSAQSLGGMLLRMGRQEEAVRWFRRDAEAGFRGAAFDAGNVLQQLGRWAEAEEWLRRAAEAGDVNAAWHLSDVLAKLGRAEEAEEWRQWASRSQSLHEKCRYGSTLADLGQVDDSERLLREAADAGHVDAIGELGFRLREWGRTEEAERWLRQAAEAGYPSSAARAVGFLLKEKGRTQEAEQWFRRAAESDPHANWMMGWMCEEAGRVEEAEYWYRRGATAGDRAATTSLGHLLDDLGRIEEAKGWLRAAADARDPVAAASLAYVFAQQGQFDMAEHWFRRAATAGDIQAAWALGSLLKELDRRDEAKVWLRRAAEAGHDGAALDLNEFKSD